MATRLHETTKVIDVEADSALELSYEGSYVRFLFRGPHGGVRDAECCVDLQRTQVHDLLEQLEKLGPAWDGSFEIDNGAGAKLTCYRNAALNPLTAIRLVGWSGTIGPGSTIVLDVGLTETRIPLLVNFLAGIPDRATATVIREEKPVFGL